MRAKKIVNQSSDSPVRHTGSYRHTKALAAPNRKLQLRFDDASRFESSRCFPPPPTSTLHRTTLQTFHPAPSFHFRRPRAPPPPPMMRVLRLTNLFRACVWRAVCCVKIPARPEKQHQHKPTSDVAVGWAGWTNSAGPPSERAKKVQK